MSSTVYLITKGQLIGAPQDEPFAVDSLNTKVSCSITKKSLKDLFQNRNILTRRNKLWTAMQKPFRDQK